MKKKTLFVLALVSIGLAIPAVAQTAPSSGATAPAPQKQTGAAPSNQPPLKLLNPGELPPTPPVQFPPPDPKNFTATSPTVQEVDAFLKDLWGYDTNRAWKVEAIQKTDAPGISRVIVFVAEQGHSTRPAETSFFVTPDGQHAIAGNQVIAFGTDPFAKTLSILRERAKGPYSGPASSSLMLVEFTDLQDPQCKAAQTSMDRLAQDFPNAHIVYQPYPNVMAHPVAEKAAEYGQCVGKLKGNAAYLQFARAVFDAQANLTAPGADQVLQEAVTKAGADLTAVKECVSGPTTKDVITGSVQLGKDLGVTQPPVLFINGRSVPLNGVPYATLKQIVAFTQTQASTPSATAATSSSAAAKKR